MNKPSATAKSTQIRSRAMILSWRRRRKAAEAADLLRGLSAALSREEAHFLAALKRIRAAISALDRGE